MKRGIKMIRKVKAGFVRYRLHGIFEPFSKIFLTLAHLSRLSKWARNTPKPEFDDFYSARHNYEKRYELYTHLIKSESLSDIYYLEFGVAQGRSFQWWSGNIDNPASRFEGFDTFTGLPEDWGSFKKGEMSAENNFPDVNGDTRCRFHKGIFQETLPSFLKDFKTDLRKVIHMDADIYSSTLYALTMLGPFLKKGDILMFDEFNVPMHEFKAFTEFTSAFYIKTTLIGAVNNYYQVAFRIDDNPGYLSR